MGNRKPDPDKIDIRVQRKKAGEPISWQVRLGRNFLEGEVETLCEANSAVHDTARLMGYELDMADVGGDAA